MKWEYYVEMDCWHNIGKQFNKLGEQGWELVCYSPQTEFDRPRFYFKRQLK